MPINLNTFRVFVTVYELKSMSAAASRLHLTQSGVSQHIRSLEQELGFSLFARENRKLFPTSQASALFSKGRKGLAEIEQAVREARKGKEQAEGVVKVGLPVEFGVNLVVPVLAELGKKYPGIDFNITLDFATVLADLVLRGEIDFALIDRFRVAPALRLEPVASETLLLCGRKDYVKAHGPVKYSTAYFSRFHYVDYREGEPIVRAWFRHHLHRTKLDIRVRARVFDVQGIARFIREGLGIGVLPHQVVERLEKEGVDLHVFEGKRAALKNEICLIQLPLKDRPLAQRLVLECLRKPAG